MTRQGWQDFHREARIAYLADLRRRRTRMTAGAALMFAIGTISACGLIALALAGPASAVYRGGAGDRADRIARAEAGVTARVIACPPDRMIVAVHIPIVRHAERRANAMLLYAPLAGQWQPAAGKAFLPLRHPNPKRVNFEARWVFPYWSDFGAAPMKARIRVWYVDRHGHALGTTSVTTAGQCG